MVNTFYPKTFDEALLIRKERPVIPFAGGTDLMVVRRRWSGLSPSFESPVLFIGYLPCLRKIERAGHELKIGAACTLTELLQNEIVPGILRTAISKMASYAIRNRATIGGNICNASPAGDTLPSLYSLNADLIVESARESRRIPIDTFIVGPGQTELKEDELLREIVIPLERFDVAFYRKVGTRKATSLSKVSFVGLVKRDDGRIRDIRISFGAVAPTVVRSKEIEDSMEGSSKTELTEAIPEIVSGFTRLIHPIDDQRSQAHYRRTISLRLLNTFLTEEAL